LGEGVPSLPFGAGWEGGREVNFLPTKGNVKTVLRQDGKYYSFSLSRALKEVYLLEGKDCFLRKRTRIKL
jgi:hypothetical protein